MRPSVPGRLITSICTQPSVTMLFTDPVQATSEPRRSLRTIPSLPPILLVLLVGILLRPIPGEAQDAQDAVPSTNFLLTGYATVEYETRVASPHAHDFGALFSPVTLFQVGPNILAESELDLELEAGATQIALEHAQLHYLGDRFQVTAGRFHLPLGLWMHQDWINRLPTPPLLYGHAHGGVAERALMPIPYDVGLMGKSKTSLGSGWSLLGRIWLTQGPRTAADSDGHDHGGSAHDSTQNGQNENGHHVEIPRIAYGTNYADNNANKMVGGRLTLMSRRSARFHVAGWHATYDGTGALATQAGNASLLLQPGPWDLRAEGILIRQEVTHHDEEPTVTKGGYYVQTARRFGALEPVLRWSHLPRSTAFEGQVIAERQRQLTVGLTYWLRPSIPLKLAYQHELDHHSDGVFLSWTVGF